MHNVTVAFAALLVMLLSYFFGCFNGSFMVSHFIIRDDVRKHGSGKFKTLAVFPSIFKGGHVKHTEMVEILTGHDIEVRFDSPCALQIDGETIRNVTSYSVHAGVPARV